LLPDEKRFDLGEAREKVRTAHAPESLPKIAAVMQRTELSYANVRALTRVACPKTEHTFLQYALVRHGGACRENRARQPPLQGSRGVISRSPAAIEPAAHCYCDHDGILVIKGRLPAAAGQMFIKTIEGRQSEGFRAQNFCGNVNCQIPP